MRTLYVKATTWDKVSKEWGFNPASEYFNVELFVRCNVKGEINWETSPIYKASELINKKVVIKL
jgi:hypothetical protein